MMPICKFADVSEHDMDMLFLEEFVVSKEFLNIFTSKVDISDATVVEVEHSKTHPEFGESDMTVIIETNGNRHGLLIEDKIDAIAMPEQYSRYIKRGEFGKENDDYSDFSVFIVAPEKYLNENVEAQKYPNKVSYEECLKYFEADADNRKHFKLSQIKQAIHKQKTGYQMIENNAVTEFWKDLQKFCEDKFPSLYMSYDGKPKGSSSTWIYFKTPVEKTWVVYKSDSGRVMLEFYSSDTSKLKEKLVPHLEDDMEFCKVGKSFGVLLHKSKWKISVKENLCDITDVITEVLEQVARLVELVKKAEFN